LEQISQVFAGFGIIPISEWNYRFKAVGAIPDTNH
jgi:hypothetical protein